MKWILISICILLAGFLALVLFLYINQRRMLYFPRGLDRYSNLIKDHAQFACEMERDGATLRGWLLNPDRMKLLIYYGGNGEELSYNLINFNRFEDYVVLLMNYRGYGESDGSPTEKDLVQDALVIFDRLKSDYNSVVLIGRSLGTGVAVQMASQRQVDRLVLVTPFDSIAAVAQEIYPWAPVSLLLKDPYDSIKAAAKVSVPALFLVADRDEVIPVHHARNLADHWKGEVHWILIQGANHNSITEFPEYSKALYQYLGE
jgi:uncharacterized protein